MKKASGFKFMERIMLQHANPVKLTCDFVGVALCFYFLWVHELIFALVLLFGVSISGNIIVWRVDIHALAKTNLGQWMLGQAKPANLIIRTVGFFILLYGTWTHSFLIMIAGVVIIVLARIVGMR
jgi:hypothetical protein